LPTSYKWRFIAIFAAIFLTNSVNAQSVGNSGSINGTVVDHTGAGGIVLRIRACGGAQRGESNWHSDQSE